MPETDPDACWSVARFTANLEGEEGALTVWTPAETRRDAFRGRTQADTAIQGVLAGGYELVQVVQTAHQVQLWFKARTAQPGEPVVA